MRRSPEVTPTRIGATPAKAGSSVSPRTSSIIARTVSSLVRSPTVGLSPYTNRNSFTPYAAAVSMSRRNPNGLRSREFRHAMLRPPIALRAREGGALARRLVQHDGGRRGRVERTRRARHGYAHEMVARVAPGRAEPGGLVADEHHGRRGEVIS